MGVTTSGIFAGHIEMGYFTRRALSGVSADAECLLTRDPTVRNRVAEVPIGTAPLSA